MKIKLHDINHLNNDNYIIKDIINCRIREPLEVKDIDATYSEELFEGYVILSDDRIYNFSTYAEIAPYNSKEHAWIECDNKIVNLNTETYFELCELCGSYTTILRAIGIIYYDIEYNGINKEKLIKK